jgi:hypothetical protein
VQQFLDTYDAEAPKEEPPSPTFEQQDDRFGYWLANKLDHDLSDLKACLIDGNQNPPDYGVNFNRLFGIAQPSQHAASHGIAAPLIERVRANVMGCKADVSRDQGREALSRTSRQALDVLEGASTVRTINLSTYVMLMAA